MSSCRCPLERDRWSTAGVQGPLTAAKRQPGAPPLCFPQGQAPCMWSEPPNPPALPLILHSCPLGLSNGVKFKPPLPLLDLVTPSSLDQASRVAQLPYFPRGCVGPLKSTYMGCSGCVDGVLRLKPLHRTPGYN